MDDLARASTAMETLNSLDSQVSDAIRAIETAFHGVGVNVRLEIVVDCDRRFSKLIWTKMHGVWCFVVDDVPLLSCARDVRASILASGLLEKLIASSADDIVARFDSRVAAIEKGKQILDAFKTTEKLE